MHNLDNILIWNWLFFKSNIWINTAGLEECEQVSNSDVAFCTQTINFNYLLTIKIKGTG